MGLYRDLVEMLSSTIGAVACGRVRLRLYERPFIITGNDEVTGS